MLKKNLLLQKDFTHTPLQKRWGGFTIIETMVAISILMTSVAIAVSVIRTDVLVSSVTKNAVMARFLAQEGIEYTRHVRDSHLVDFDKTGDSTIDWLGGLGACSNGTPCTIDTANPTSVIITSYPIGGCPVLKYSEAENRYGYTNDVGWEESIFKREINIADPLGGVIDSEVIVTVRVSWTERDGSDKEVVYQQNLFNWIK